MAIITRIYRFLIPEDINLRQRRLELLLWSFLLSLSFYSGWFGILAWFALIRPLMIISSLKGKAAFKASYFFGFFFNLFSLYWVALVTPPGMISAVIIVAFYYAVVLTVFNKLHNYKPFYAFVMIPFLWTGMEYFRTLSEFAFPWSDLGYTQSYYLYILQIVSVISVHGLSFLIVTVNVLLLQIWRSNLSPERRLTSFFSASGIVIALFAFGWVVMPRFPLPGEFQVALLQGSVPLEVKWARGNAEHNYHLYDSLTQAVQSDSVGLYVWPETSVPCYLTHDRRGRQAVGSTARRSNGYHLVGSLGATLDECGERHYNSCYQVNPAGVIETQHDKVKLVPFAEHVPYQDNLPFLKREVLEKYLTFIKTYDVQWWSDFYPGDSLTMFQLPDAAYAVMICFEITFPEYVREAILEGAEFMVGITNDTWFGSSIGTHMHSRIFITRMVENRCWGVRVANSGLTYVVDDYGNIREDIPAYEVAAIRSRVRLLGEYSTFTRYGDVIGRLSFLITLSLMGILLAIWLITRFTKQKVSW